MLEVGAYAFGCHFYRAVNLIVLLYSGLDIPTVQVVINYELPADATDYIHRVGRTARAGRGGLSLSLVTQHDINLLLNIETKMKKKMHELPVEENEVLEILNEVSLAQRVANMVCSLT